MNNFWFYWAMWFFWITLVFFFKKGRTKTVVSLLLLCVITLSPINVPIGNAQLNLAFVLIGLAGCSLLSNRSFSKVFKLGVCASIIMMIDVLAQIYWLYDPAILMVLPQWTFIPFLGFFVLTLTSDFRSRLAILLIGMSQGEILQSLVFYPYDNVVGDQDYLVMVSFLLMFVTGWVGLNHGASLLRTISLTRTAKRLEK